MRGSTYLAEIGYLSDDARIADLPLPGRHRPHERCSLVPTINLPFSDWPQLLSECRHLRRLPVARVVHRAGIIAIEGANYRRRVT